MVKSLFVRPSRRVASSKIVAVPMRGSRRPVVKFTKPVPMRPGGFLSAVSRVGRGPELFSKETANATYVADTTGTVTLLNGIAQGDDINQRKGRRITNKAVHIQGIVEPVDASTNSTLARVIVVYDRQPNGAALTVADVLTSVNSHSFNKLDNRNRFLVLADKKFFIGAFDNTATQTYAGSPFGHKVEIHKRISLPTTHMGTGDTIASIATGSIYMVTVGDQAPNAGGVFSLTARLRYTDV